MGKKGKGRLFGSALLAAVLAVAALVALYRASSEQAPVAVSPPPRAAAPVMREVVLYFGSPDGSYLVPETREIEACPVETDCLQRIVEALAAGPTAELVPLLPSQTKVRQARVEDGIAVLDLSRDLIDRHPGGSLSELLTVYSLVDTVAVNFPHIRKTSILIEGQVVETLRGHLGLQEPVKADFRYARPPEAVDGRTTEPARNERNPL